MEASGTDLTGLSANTDLMEASGPDLTGLSASGGSSDACVSSKAVSELLYPLLGRGGDFVGPPASILRFSRGSAASQCRFRNFYIRTIFIIFEDLSGFFFLILFVIHQVAHGGIGVPFRVGLSRLDLMLKYLRFYFRYLPMSIMRFNMLLPASVKELI